MALTPTRLKRLARHRERLERAQQGRLAEASRRRADRESLLASSVADRRTLIGQPAPIGVVDAGALIAGEGYRLRLEREIAARAAALHHSDEEVAAERAVLLERRRDLKAIEALLDRRLEEERLQRNRDEVKRLDELAGVRWARKVTTGGEA